MVTRNPVAEGILVILFAVVLFCFRLMHMPVKCLRISMLFFLIRFRNDQLAI
jgi:hypothetical protein